MSNRTTVILSGALAGALAAVALFAVFVGRYATSGAVLGDGGDAQLVVTSGALYLAAVVISLIGGSAVAVVAYGAGSVDVGEGTRFELTHILPFGLVAAVASGYSILRAGVGFAGDAAAGEVTISAAALGFTTLLAGFVTGGIVAWVVATLAAKSVVGLEGEAAPSSTTDMMRAATKAVTGPMIAVVVIAALAIALSQLLLAAEGVAAIAIFSGAAALVLLGAAGAVYLGGPKDDNAA